MFLILSQMLRQTVLLPLYLLVCSASPSYYIAAPSNTFLGANISLAVHWFGGSDITVSAEMKDGFRLLTNISEVFQNDSIRLLTFPKVSANSNSVELVVNGSFQDTLVFSDRIKLQMQMPNTSIFIQTDKNTYRPGEMVRIRVVTVNYDLKPYTGDVDIEISDPRSIVVQQYLKVKSDLGVISTQFLLANNLMFGYWFIRAKSNGCENTVSFSVTEIVFNRFDVTLDAPTFYIDSKMQDLTGTITAKYFNGLPVKGNVTISVTPVIAEVFNEVNKTYNMSGVTGFSFTPTELSNIYIWAGLNITASVTEELTGIVINTSSVVRRVKSEYTISIIHPVISPSLNFTAQIQVQRIDNQPLSNEERNTNISVKISLSTGLYYTSRDSIDNNTTPATIIQKNYTIPVSGIVNLEFPIGQSIQWIHVQAEYQNSTETLNFEKPSTISPYIQIRITETLLKVGTPFQLRVETYPEVQDIYYVVIANGMVVAAGKNITTFSLMPGQAWAPYAQLTVYFRSVNNSFGDIMQISQMLTIKGALKNKVNLSWSKNNAAPSEKISLSASVMESRSLVGLQVVEKGSSALEGRNDLTESKIDEMIWNNYQSSLTSLSDAIIYNTEGDFILTINEKIVEGPAISVPLIQSKAVFIDTWIWLETNISSSLSTSLQVTVPNKNTTWVATAFVMSEGLGLGVMNEPIELSVIKPLFITLNMPTSLTRGEQFILEVMLTNTQKEDVQVTVTLESSNSFEIIVPNNNSDTKAGVRIVIVPKENSTSVLFPINPKVLGNISITINAASNSASDTLTRYIIVRAEGVRNFYSQSQIFEVLGSENAPQTVSKNFSFTFPSDVVQGSEEAFVTVVGDLLGPSIKGLESLITMPYGCGEQTMIVFAPNIYILLYLIATQQITEDIRVKTIDFMQQGYQRELLYWRSDGSFSAFGNSDASGSSWLTAFVVRCFLQARPFINIDSNVLNQSMDWLVQFQNLDTGIFSEPGNVIHKELQGGLNGPITITAYIITSLLEDEYYRQRYAVNIEKAVQYLESKLNDGIASNYTLSVVVYALTLANSSKAQSALNQLSSRATITADGTKYWSAPSEAANYIYWQPRTTDIETSAYALLSYYRQSQITDGIPVMKWLSQQRNYLGGYSSTQDTVMALQALSMFVSAVPSGQTSLTVTVTGSGSFVPKSFQIASNLLVLQSQQIEISQPLSITVIAYGRGLAIFQFNVMYNTKASSRRRRNAVPEVFSLDITPKEDATNIYKLAADVCMSYLGNDTETGMVMLEFGLLNGFNLSSEGIPTTEIVKLVEPTTSHINIYLSKLTKNEVCIYIPMVRVANVVGSQDAVVKVYEYYKPRNSGTRTYNSVTMKNVSYCSFCGLNCTQCASNVKADPQPSNACIPTISMLSFSMLLLYHLL